MEPYRSPFSTSLSVASIQVNTRSSLTHPPCIQQKEPPSGSSFEIFCGFASDSSVSEFRERLMQKIVYTIGFYF
jgi:hypothetical protein